MLLLVAVQYVCLKISLLLTRQQLEELELPVES